MMIFSLRRKLWLILILTVLLFLAYSAVGESGFMRLNRMRDQRDELRSRVRSLQESNALLADEIGRLRGDPETIEYIARTELGMVRDGEVVYILPEESEDPSK